MDSSNIQKSSLGVESQNSVSSNVSPQPTTLKANLQQKRVKKLVIVGGVVIVFLVAIISTLLVLNTRNSDSKSASDNKISQELIESTDTVVQQEQEEETVTPDQVDPDFDLSKECSDKVRGVKFNIPSNWECTINETGSNDSFAVSAKSNDSDEYYVALSNLGRGLYCGSPEGDGENCTSTPFFKNDLLDINLYQSQDGGEVFGAVNFEDYNGNSYVSLNYKGIGFSNEMSGVRKDFIVQLLKTIESFEVSESTDSTFEVSSIVKSILDKYNYIDEVNTAWSIKVPDTQYWTRYNQPNMHASLGGEMNHQGEISFNMSLYYPTFFETGIPTNINELIEYSLDGYSDADKSLFTNIEYFTVQNYEIAFVSPKADNTRMANTGDTNNLASLMVIFDYSGKTNPRILSIYKSKFYDDSANIADMQHNVAKYFGEKIILNYPGN